MLVPLAAILPARSIDPQMRLNMEVNSGENITYIFNRKQFNTSVKKK